MCEDSWETYDKLYYYLLGNYLKPVYLIEVVELKIALIIQTLYVLNVGKCWLDALEVAQNQGYSIQKDNKGMYVYTAVDQYKNNILLAIQ